MVKNKPKRWFYYAAFVLAIGFVFPFFDKGGFSFPGLLAYSLIALVAAATIEVSWWSIKKLNPPSWLPIVLVVALGLRLIVALGLFTGLPALGYQDSKPHSTGYIYQDAYERDKDAWRFAISDSPLLAAWTDADLSDQYGGLHFISTGIYRIISIDEHRPLLLVLLTATYGSIAVLFTWSASNRIFGDQVSRVSAWIVALYPEAVLLSASQMREPFLIAALALGIDGYSLVRIEEWKNGVPRVLGATLIALVLSPPVSLILLGLLAIAWVWEGRVRGGQRVWAYALIVSLGVIGLLLTVRGWSNIPGSPDGGVFQLLAWWVSSGAEYQLFLLTQGSGWVQKVFALVPEWSHMPLATLYGIVQPFLPAAIMDSSSAALVRLIVSLRAAGWFITLPFLLYAPFLSLRRKQKVDLASYFVLIFWLAAIIVSYRDAGRMWDNPRWRAIFLCIQAMVVAWTWWRAKERRDPWLKRMAIIVALATLAFLQWEAGRYYGLPRLNLWETLALIGGFSVLFITGSLIYDRRLRERHTFGDSSS